MIIKGLIRKNLNLMAVFSILILITLLTSYYGSADIGDYSDTSKFFADKYDANIRGSHSYFYGGVFSIFLFFFDSFFIFKIGSLIFLSLIILSVYFITGENERSLWLMLLSPVVWYMAPWINPIQLASLLILWSYFFMTKYEKSGKLKHLFYSGVLIGLGWAFWDTVIFFGAFLLISFMYNKKLSHAIYFSLFVLVGIGPRLIFDQIMFNFALFTILKSFGGQVIFALNGGIYNQWGVGSGVDLLSYFIFFLGIPLYSWLIYSADVLKNNKKSVIFISLCFLLILMNPQLRYLIVVVPIIIVLISNRMSKMRFEKQIIFSIIIIALFVFPYIIQITHSIDNEISGVDFLYISRNPLSFELYWESPEDNVLEDLGEISKEFPSENYVIGPSDDSYQVLAHIYWGDEIKEFVSIQDYELYYRNESEIFSRKFMPVPNIRNRRQIWIAGGINKNENDDTNYDEIKYMINIGEYFDGVGFEKIKSYKMLSVWERID